MSYALEKSSFKNIEGCLDILALCMVSCNNNNVQNETQGQDCGLLKANNILKHVV